jgi:hypothetical protein
LDLLCCEEERFCEHSSSEKTKAPIALPALIRKHAHHVLELDWDTGYETGDSDVDVRAERLAKKLGSRKGYYVHAGHSHAAHKYQQQQPLNHWNWDEHLITALKAVSVAGSAGVSLYLMVSYMSSLSSATIPTTETTDPVLVFQPAPTFTDATMSFGWKATKWTASFLWSASTQNPWLVIVVPLVARLAAPWLVGSVAKLILSLVGMLIKWEMSFLFVPRVNNKKLAASNAEIKRARELVYHFLTENAAWHKVDRLRDVVKDCLYPNDHEAQSRFVESAWEALCDAVARDDEQILVRTKIINGSPCTLWKWNGAAL